jgi:Tfp pilus assembly protein FimT
MQSVNHVLHSSRQRQRGISIVELSIVVAILVACAAVVMPGVVAIQHSRDLKDIEASIARLPSEARNDAIRTQNPVQMKIEGSTLVIQQTDADSGQPKTLKQVDLGDNLRVADVQENGQTVDTGSWQWTAYPDGASDSGGIQFDEGHSSKSLNMPTNGEAEWISGPLPDQSEQQWPAGQLAQRNGTSSTPTTP